MAVVQKVRCAVEKVVAHGEQVFTVTLRPERPVPRFRPGQFLHLALDAYDPSGFWPESRVFSIATPPVQRDRVEITYAVKGRFTGRMARELAAGREVWIKLPYGEFVIEDTRDVVLFAGGTGITAFTAFLAGLSADFRHPVILAYGARRRELLIYREWLTRQAPSASQLRVLYFIEEETVGPDERPGRLSAAALWPLIPDPAQSLFYLSGPPAMLKTLTTELQGLGIAPAAIRIDAWE
jgi:ferredoxin-NADP reductase